ncbi:MAG: lyase family protein, partial [Bacteroidota bacterium]
MKLWDKGYSSDKKIENFTVGNDREIDLKIAKYDVQASLAHAIMLESIGLLSSEELAELKTAFNDISANIESGDFIIENDFEDVHSKIEFELTKSLGDVGKKIHTARSRNDQVLVALQLYYKDNLNVIDSKIKV